MSKELMTTKRYEPPFWEGRAWNPEGHDQWERKALVALEHGSEETLNKLLSQRERAERWSKPYGKSRAFALDIWADIIAGERHEHPTETPAMLFEEWQMQRDLLMARWDELDQWPTYEASVETAQIQAVQP